MLALGGAESLRAATPSDSPTGLQSEVVFADYSSFSAAPPSQTSPRCEARISALKTAP
jgi:hypothetical protein